MWISFVLLLQGLQVALDPQVLVDFLQRTYMDRAKVHVPLQGGNPRHFMEVVDLCLVMRKLWGSDNTESVDERLEQETSQLESLSETLNLRCVSCLVRKT